MLYSVGNEVGKMVFRFEDYFEISMFKEFCNIFGLRSCIGEGRPDCLSCGGYCRHVVFVKMCGGVVCCVFHR